MLNSSGSILVLFALKVQQPCGAKCRLYLVHLAPFTLYSEHLSCFRLASPARAALLPAAEKPFSRFACAACVP